MTFRVILVGLLLSALTACGAPTTPSAPPLVPTALPVSAQQLPTVTTASPAVQPASPTLESTVLPTALPEKPTSVAPAADINTDMPQLIFPTANGLLAVTADGTSQRLFSEAQPVIGHNLKDGIAPFSGWVAFTSGDNPMTPDPERSGPLTLNLLNVTDGSLTPITPLFAPDMEEAIRAANLTGDRNDAVEAGIAVVDNSDTLKWSPNGRYLAFIAAIDGPSSDVYSYDRETGEIKRLTDGLNQAARLFWSPDSQWIVHEEVENFGTGAGWSVKAVWAAAPDDSGNRKLYDTEWSGDEIFLDWITPDAFLVYSWSPLGLQNARVFNLAKDEATRIGPDFPVQAYAVEPSSQTQVYVVDDYTARENNLPGGLYFDSLAQQPQLSAPGNWYEVRWLPHAQLFFAKGEEGVISVTANGIVTKYDGEEALPIDAPDGAWLLAWGDGNYTSPIGLRLYTPDGELKRTITSDSVAFATWSPDADGVFYQSEGQLYFVEIPNGEPQLIGDSTARELSNLGWAQP